MDVEMRHLRALVAVADELNFTRTADRLHLTRQAPSGKIRQLEHRVGTRLVDRDPRHVALTPAGNALPEKARPLLAGAQHALAVARAAGGGATELSVGYIAPLTRRRRPRLRGDGDPRCAGIVSSLPSAGKGLPLSGLGLG